VKVMTVDGKVGWVAKEYLKTASKGSTDKDSKSGGNSTSGSSNTSTNLTFLSQTNPCGPDSILDIKRGPKENSWNGEITDIKSHIGAYGCLMTSLTMIMNDKGSKVNVTDLYIANYKIKKGTELVKDAENSGDNHIELNDLNSGLSIVNEADENFVGDAGSFSTEAGLLGSSINSAIEEHGEEIVIETTRYATEKNPESRHWVVINKNDDGSYTIRDPMESEAKTYQSLDAIKKVYKSLTGRFRYVERNNIKDYWL